MTYIEFFLLAGGLGMFLFGMSIMGTGLKSVAGDKLQGILEKATRNPFLGMLLGTGATCLVQSSGATMMMSIGFVSSGLMTVAQSVGVILGANIGTTITGQIIAFHLSDIAPLIVFIGAILYLFVKKESVHGVSMIILGFGLLFLGIGLMGDAVDPLKSSPIVVNALETISNPFLAMLIGLVITAILQSSSSSVGIIQVFAMQGLMDVRVAVFMVIGTSIGAVTPALLACLSANRDGKRTSMVALIYNVIRTIICMAVMLAFPQIIEFFIRMSDSPARQIANMHTVMAIVTVLICLPFSKAIANLATKIIPVKESEIVGVEKKLMYLTEMNLPTGMTLMQARHELVRMGHIVDENLQLALASFHDHDAEKGAKVRKVEEVVDFLCHGITSALVQVNHENITDSQMNRVGVYIKLAADLERISDLAENIVEFGEEVQRHNITFSDKGQAQLDDICDKTAKAVSLSIQIFEDKRSDLVEESNELERTVDALKDKCIEDHVNRLMRDECNGRSGIVFTEMANDLERAADHAHNIVKSLGGLSTLEEVVESASLPEINI